MASQTKDTTAGVGDILSGKIVCVNGSKITGSMANKGAVNGTVAPRGTYTIPARYHNGSGTATSSAYPTCKSQGYKKIQAISRGNLSWHKVDFNDISTLSPNSMTRISPINKICQSIWEFPLESGKQTIMWSVHLLCYILKM